jgi:hypothetical protein
MIKGFDCASIVKPEWAPQLAALGYQFFARYYRRTLVSKYAVSPEEAKHLFDAGLWALAIFQNTSNVPSYFTKENALADGHAAIAKAQQMKQPKSSTIYFAVDTNPGHEQIPLVLDYFDTILHVLAPEGYIVGAYGCGAVLKALKEASLIRRTWLANAKGWGGYKDFLGQQEVLQTTLPFTLPFGLEVDNDEAVNPQDAGLWRP